MAEKTKRERDESRLSALRAERQRYEPVWQDLARHLVPYRLVLDPRNPDRGMRRDVDIINSLPVRAVKTHSAFLQAGVTSPTRPWFRLAVSDPELGEVESVKTHLHTCENRLVDAFHASNLYRSLSSATYPDLAAIGTHAMFMESPAPGRLHFRPMPIGEFWIDVNHHGRVDTCFRDLSMSVRQVFGKFGRKNVSQTIRNLWDRGDYNAPVRVIHAIQPNSEYRPEARLDKKIGRPFSSCWWEFAADNPNAYLEESGYYEFPVLAPRWSALPSDAYGIGPGWDALGDCRALQHHEKVQLELADLTRQPPMRATGSVHNASLVASEVTEVESGGGFEPSYVPDAKALEIANMIVERHERRVEAHFHVHLMQMMANDDRNQRMTATEVEERRTEKALMLGPMLESINEELLEPLVENAFYALERIGALPPRPPELEGADVTIEFVSIMHKVQEAQRLVSVRTLMTELSGIATMFPEALDKIDVDEVIDDLGKISGVSPNVVLSKEEVAKVRRIKAEHRQAEADGQAMLAATQGVKNLSSADPTKLGELASAISPAGAAQLGVLPQ